MFLAHLYLGRQAEPLHEVFLAAYDAVERFDMRLALRFCGVEIMRRLIGVAQLPLELDLAGKRALLHLSHELVTRDDVLKSKRLVAKHHLADLLPSEDDQDADARCA